MAQGRRIAAYLGQGHVTNTWQFGSESTYDDTALKNKINGVSETLSQLQDTVAQLPTTDNDTIYDDTQVRSLIESLQEQVAQLPTEDTDTVYDDAEVRSLISSLQETVAQLPTTDNDTIYDDTEVRSLVTQLQEQVAQLPTTDNDTIYDDTAIQQALQSLQEFVATLPTEDTDTVYDDTAMRSRINSLSDDLVALSETVAQLPTTDNDTVYDDTAIQATIQALQEQVNALPTTDNDTIYDDTEVRALLEQAQQTITALQNTVATLPTTDNDTQADWNVTDTTSPAFIANKPTIPVAMIAEYQQTTAQEIAEFLDENPAAPLLIKQSDGSLLTAIYAHKQSDSKVNVRCIGTIQGEYYVFDHTINGSSWSATQYPFHDGVGGASTFSGSWNDLTDKPTLFSGSWNDLTDKPTIPDAQVNADWNETDNTSKAFIENKPALPDFSLVPQVKLVMATVDEVSIPAGGRVNKQPEFDAIPDGYEVYAYRQISIERATSLVGDNTNPKYDTWMNVSIQTFSTAGSGTKANISMVNSGTTDALIKLKTRALVMKIGV